MAGPRVHWGSTGVARIDGIGQGESVPNRLYILECIHSINFHNLAAHMGAALAGPPLVPLVSGQPRVDPWSSRAAAPTGIGHGQRFPKCPCILEYIYYMQFGTPPTHVGAVHCGAPLIPLACGEHRMDRGSSGAAAPSASGLGQRFPKCTYTLEYNCYVNFHTPTAQPRAALCGPP